MYYGVVQYLTYNLIFFELGILLLTLPFYIFLWTMVNKVYEEVYGKKTWLIYVPFVNMFLAYRILFSKLISSYIIFLQFIFSLFMVIFEDRTVFFNGVANVFNFILLAYYFLIITYAFNLIIKNRKREEKTRKN